MEPILISDSDEPLVTVLFVDDEQSILDGLRRSLRAMRSQWQMNFANSGSLALKLMAEQEFDVVVTDMRMPGIDGLELLTRVRKEWPHAIRIVLSGQTELQEALHVAALAQAFLRKPCDTELLKSTIERTTALAREFNNTGIRQFISSVDSLPSPPVVLSELNRCLAATNVDIDMVVSIVNSDQAITAKFLQLANLAMVAPQQEVSNVEEAITCLGLSNVRDLAAAAAIFGANDRQSALVHRLEDIETQSIRAVRVARSLCGDALLSPAMLTAVILHDIGKLIIAISVPEVDEVLTQRELGGENRTDVEQELLGVTHGAIGSYLLNVWGVPHGIVEAAAWHHVTPPMKPWMQNGLHLTYLTEAIINHRQDLPEVIPPGYLEALGCTETVQTAISLANSFEDSH